MQRSRLGATQRTAVALVRQVVLVQQLRVVGAVLQETQQQRRPQRYQHSRLHHHRGTAQWLHNGSQHSEQQQRSHTRAYLRALERAVQTVVEQDVW